MMALLSFLQISLACFASSSYGAPFLPRSLDPVSGSGVYESNSENYSADMPPSAPTMMGPSPMTNPYAAPPTLSTPTYDAVSWEGSSMPTDSAEQWPSATEESTAMPTYAYSAAQSSAIPTYYYKSSGAYATTTTNIPGSTPSTMYAMSLATEANGEVMLTAYMALEMMVTPTSTSESMEMIVTPTPTSEFMTADMGVK